MLDARAFMISTLRSQVGFAAAVAHARLSASLSSRLELFWGIRPQPPAATRLHQRAPSFRRPLSSRRGEALWEREAAGSGSPGAVSSESAAGFGMVVRFVCVIRVSVCLVCVVRLPPESFYRLFTGTVPVLYRYCTGTVPVLYRYCTGTVRVCVVGFGWMVVRFVRVIRAVFVRVCVRLGLGGWL